MEVKDLKPTAGHALIEPIKRESEVGGIALPETQDERTQRGKVIALGPTPKDEEKPGFTVGDMVVHKSWGSDEFKLDITGKRYLFIKFEDVLAIVKEN